MSIEDTIDNLPKPGQFTDKLDELQQKIGPILEDFKKYYKYSLNQWKKALKIDSDKDNP